MLRRQTRAFAFTTVFGPNDALGGLLKWNPFTHEMLPKRVTRCSSNNTGGPQRVQPIASVNRNFRPHVQKCSYLNGAGAIVVSVAGL